MYDTVNCPVCNFECSHLKKCHLIRDAQDSIQSVVLHMDGTKEYTDVERKNLRFNGPIITLYFEGECGHEWLVIYGEHKGNVFTDKCDCTPSRKEKYCEYLLSDQWKEIARQKREEAGNKCQLCNGNGRLHVHHRTYERIFNETMDDLIVLCESCHKKFHDKAA